MRARGRVSVVIAAIAVLGAVAVPRINAHRGQDADGCPHSGGTNVAVTRTTILCLLNQERAKHGLPALRRNAILEAASQRHSEDMARRHFFAHDTPDGMSPGERMGAAAMEGWMHSPGHRENVLRPEFSEVGVGVVYDAPFWVGKRRAAIYTTDFGGA